MATKGLGVSGTITSPSNFISGTEPPRLMRPVMASTGSAGTSQPAPSTGRRSDRVGAGFGFSVSVALGRSVFSLAGFGDSGPSGSGAGLLPPQPASKPSASSAMGTKARRGRKVSAMPGLLTRAEPSARLLYAAAVRTSTGPSIPASETSPDALDPRLLARRGAGAPPRLHRPARRDARALPPPTAPRPAGHLPVRPLAGPAAARGVRAGPGRARRLGETRRGGALQGRGRLVQLSRA